MGKTASFEEKDNKLKQELDELMKGMNSHQFEGSIDMFDTIDFVDSEQEETPQIPKINIGAEIKHQNTQQTAPKPTVNIADLDRRFKTQAKNLIESMYDFYLSYGVIDKPEYLEKKNALNTINLSNMLFQLKMTKVVLGKVMEDIDAGNTNPKVIESFCNLNSQMADLTRDQANYLIFLEETYKKAKIEAIDYNLLKSTHDEKKSISIKSEIQDVEEVKEISKEEKLLDFAVDDNDENFFVTSDPLVLMEEINNGDISEEDVRNERSDYLKERGDVSRFVNYANKNDLVEEYEVDATTIKEENEIDDDSDLLEMI